MSNQLMLLEEDVPGAKFMRNSVEEHSVRELKRWLECRGLKRTGNKKELVERCRNCITAGRAGLLDVAVDRGKWFQLKTGAAERDTPSKGGPSVSNSFPSTASTLTDAEAESFQLFPSVNVPELFNKGHIYFYLIESVAGAAVSQNLDSENDYEDVGLSTEKPYRRGQQYIDSGNVGNLYDCYVNNKYIVKCAVKSSFRDTYYKVRVELSRLSGNIIRAFCECKASALGRCSHVSALLLSIDGHVAVHGFIAQSSTSKPRVWGKGCLKRAPQKIAEADYPSAIDRIKRATFDPRSHLHQSTEATAEEANNLLSLLDFSVTGTKQTFWQEILKYKYQDFQLLTEETEILKQQCNMFIDNLGKHVNSKPQATFLLADTDGQSLSTTWIRWRNVLVTASTAHQLLSLTQPGAKAKYLRKKLWNLDKFSTKAMRYGLENEGRARQDYETHLKSVDPNAHIVTTGLWMNKKYPQFGCSPDGLIFGSGRKGILEIKCPALLETCAPKEFSEVLLPTQKNNFCLKIEEGEIKLKKNHAYYMQIQISMLITETTFCDFCVWSAKGLVIIKIDFDNDFCSRVLPRLISIHRHLIVPEYFIMRTVRDLNPIELEY